MKLSYALVLLCLAGSAGAQTSKPPHPATTIPPAQPPIVLKPLPPQEKEGGKLCTRDVLVPCTDERTRSCTRKETYRCD